MPNLEKDTANYQTELFQLLGEFFGRATGVPPQDFATIETFPAEIRKNASMLGHRGEEAFGWADRELKRFYASRGAAAFGAATRLGGLKLVLGGSSRFRGSHLAAARGSLLYADTVLIPDPVLPWFERNRTEEKFHHVLLLQAVHAILHLRPIVDADLPHCPVVVFPSFEKILEENDQQTQKGTFQLLVDVLAQYVDPTLASMDDVAAMLRDHPDRFLRGVESSQLLVAPGGSVGASIADALAEYENHAKTWRSDDWLQEYSALSPAAKAMYALSERLTPQYHLLENAEEFKAHPLICIEQQAHYYNLISGINSSRLEKVELLDEKTKALLRGLGSERLAWLSDVPIEALVEIRANSESDAFRKRLTNSISGLHEAALGDTDRVAAEMCREIDAGIAEHNRLLRAIHQKYADRAKKWIAGAAVTSVGMLAPSLAPYLGATLPLALAGTIGWDRWERSLELKRQSKSLMGVLAIARASQD